MKQFTLFYDNGTGYFDPVYNFARLDEAVKAAKTGWQTGQYITNGQIEVWANHKRPGLDYCPRCRAWVAPQQDSYDPRDGVCPVCGWLLWDGS